MAAVTQWGATYTIKEMKGRIGWHYPTRAEEDEIINLSRDYVEPALEELQKMINDKNKDINIIRIKQIMAIMIGFLSGSSSILAYNLITKYYILLNN